MVRNKDAAAAAPSSPAGRRRHPVGRRWDDIRWREAEQRFQAIWVAASDAMVLSDPAGLVLMANPAYGHLYGYPLDQMVGHDFALIYPAHAHAEARQGYAVLFASATPPSVVEATVRRMDGTLRRVEAHVSFLTRAGMRTAMLSTIRDVTDRQRAEAAVRAERDFSDAVVETVDSLIVVLDREGRIVRFNRACERVTGYTADEVRGRIARDLFVPPEEREGARAVAAVLHAGGLPVAYENHWLTRAGDRRLIAWSNAALRGLDGRVSHLIGTGIDITERARAEHLLRHHALHDALTGLPNRTLFGDRLEHAVRAATRDHAPLALLLLDLDHFKDINDALGHPVGDRLLREVAARLGTAIRAADTVARLGGDEFAVIVPGADASGAAHVARTLHQALTAPLVLDDHALHVAASIGGALFPTHGADTDTLLRHADAALYLAKRERRGYAVYDPAQDRDTLAHVTRTAALRAAIAQGALVLHYQPKVALASGQRRWVEALVRWPHPVEGLIPPDAFIPLAEETGLIDPLTRWVLAEALRQRRVWQQAGYDVTVEVNMSAVTLRDAAFPDTVAALLRTDDTPPARLRLELTESALMTDPGGAAALLDQLNALGVRSVIDDFGTGYSSLAYLTQLPVDELKIDRSFVRTMAAESASAAIVRATIGLAHSLGLTVVAEGVEDRATWDLLAQLGCDLAQGYYISRPLPAPELLTWLRTASPRV